MSGKTKMTRCDNQLRHWNTKENSCPVSVICPLVKYLLLVKMTEWGDLMDLKKIKPVAHNVFHYKYFSLFEGRKLRWKVHNWQRGRLYMKFWSFRPTLVSFRYFETHHCRWRAANVGPCSALLSLEKKRCWRKGTYTS